MCGISGLWRFAGAPADELAAQSRAMTDAIAYRGPDGDGHWSDPAVGIALGHRRLAIIDLTPSGLQPMHSHDGRIVITYNGELYNRAEMAAELDRPWRGTSDTEVLVEAIAAFGIDGALARANGLFAFAAFDRGARTLHLARDRLGIKPLYWTRQNGVFAFASELKALRALAGLTFALDPGALASYLRYACVPAPGTIFRDVAKLAPGHRVEARADGVTVRRYWDVAEVARRGQQAPDLRPEPEIVDELHDLLADAVKRQMVSDVPLGAFLSGGIDSSAVVALMQRAASRPVKTFSIGFREQAFNEAANAKAVAQHLGTDHTELVLSAADAQAIIPQLPAIYDEPFADSSQLPTFLVSRLARGQVTVALSGDGGDEVFGGYVRYQGIARLAGVARRLPGPLRRLAANAIELVSADAWDMLAHALPSRLRPSHPGDKIRKGAAILGKDDPLEMYRRVVSYTPEPGRLLPGVTEPADVVARLGAETRSRCGRKTAAARHADLPAGRYSHQGRPRLDGGEPGGAGAAARSSGGGIRLAASVEPVDRQPRGQAAAARGACPLRAARAGRSAQDRVRHSGRRMAQGAVAAVGRGPPVARRAGGRAARPRGGAALVRRIPVRPARRAARIVGGAAVPGVAPGLCVIGTIH
jgi:asparagine synthase (glutamine-hydrolysing)